jgi:hypothetical protein
MMPPAAAMRLCQPNAESARGPCAGRCPRGGAVLSLSLSLSDCFHLAAGMCETVVDIE